MDRDEAMRLLRGGEVGIDEWNRRRRAIESENFLAIDLETAEGHPSHLVGADLAGVHLAGVHLARVYLAWAVLTGANLARANLGGADLGGADLTRANLTRANLMGADLTGAVLAGADLTGAACSGTSFNDMDLSTAKGLDAIRHFFPSHVSTSTLTRSRGQIPEAFLRGCGLTPWEVLSASLYNRALTPAKLGEIQRDIFAAWTKGRSMISGCFFSYSWADRKFVDKLGTRLENEGIKAWIDRNKMLAGPLQPQIWRAIQDHQAVILVLSKDSVQSDWVENELDIARSKEKAERRAVLCPVALDDAWDAKVKAKDGPGDSNRKLWLTLLQKHVMDFSRWKTKAFEKEFEKLLDGLKLHYGPVDPPAAL
jgi:uncharacterized protein YjbI with pentapeptide repeats